MDESKALVASLLKVVMVLSQHENQESHRARSGGSPTFFFSLRLRLVIGLLVRAAG